MGTNYYLERQPQPCATCGHDGSRDFHIGKSSAGWAFTWHGYLPDDTEVHAGPKLTTPSEWFAFLARQVEVGAVIRDEYGHEHTLDTFTSRVLSKREPRANGDPPCTHGITVEGDNVVFYEFS